MRFARGLTPLLVVLSAGSIVSACAKPVTLTPSFPSAVDLTVPEKPAPTVETLTSAAASAELNSKIEEWGDGLASQVKRLCGWAKANGMRDAPC